MGDERADLAVDGWVTDRRRGAPEMSTTSCSRLRRLKDKVPSELMTPMISTCFGVTSKVTVLASIGLFS